MSSNQPHSLGAAAVRPLREPFSINWGRLNVVGALLLAIGIIGFVAAFAAGRSDRIWEIWLVNLLYFMGIAQAGVVCSCAFYLTQARWAGSAHYRLAEAYWPFIPLGLILFAGVFVGRAQIFPWVTHPIAQKAAWLNVPFLFARDGIALLILSVLSRWFVSASRRREAQLWALSTGDIEMPPPTIRRLAPIIAILYCFFYSMLSVDLIMSLSPQWRSTLFGWWFFATLFWGAIVAMSFTAILLRPKLGPNNVFNRGRVRHDLGLMVFAFSIFWIYLSFAQYLVIWYGDIPVETFFLMVRLWHHPWTLLGWIPPLLIWAVPFVVLMGVRPKRTPKILGSVALLGLIGVWDLIYILVVPSLSPNNVRFGWIELSITAGFLGAFLLCAVPGLKRLADAAVAGSDGGE